VNQEILTLAFERAAGVCECIGGGCPSFTHRPGVNRCSEWLRTVHMVSFFAVSRFADLTDPDNIAALCSACGENPRRAGHRLTVPRSRND
jgi:hypothetical protein